MIILGSKVRDTVSGITGIAVARTQWLHSCERITIQPPVDKDGKLMDAYTVDEPQIEVLIAAKPKATPTSGGDQVATRQHGAVGR